jgi:hypothetical protein
VLCVVVQVKTNAANNVCGHTFYVMDASGTAPERAAVERACQQVTSHHSPCSISAVCMQTLQCFYSSMILSTGKCNGRSSEG